MTITLLLLLLLSGSFVTYFSGDKWASKIALLFSILACFVSIALLINFQNGADLNYNAIWIEIPKIYVAFKVDGLSMAMVLLCTLLTPLIVLSSFETNFKNAKSLYALVLFMSFAMVGTFISEDGFLYYIFWELALIPIYFIALLWGNGNSDERKKAVIKFFIYTIAGSLFMLAAFAYLYQKAGSFLLSDLVALNLSNEEQFWIFLGFFMAYAIKIPIIPFHTWQANVYEKSPSIGTMLLSGIMLKMGLYSVIRWQLPIAPNAAKEYIDLFIILSLIGVIYGSILALRQKDLKKLLAYSSLAHVGLIAAGCYALNQDGLSGAVAQMIAHGFVIVGLFFAVEIIERRYQTRMIDQLGGIRTMTPKFASQFLILVLASVALPGTYNFIGEFTVLYSLSQIDVLYAIFGGTTVILGAYYMLKMYQNVMLGESNKTPFKDVSPTETIVMILIIGFLLFFGIYPKPITSLIEPSIIEIVSQINR